MKAIVKIHKQGPKTTEKFLSLVFFKSQKLVIVRINPKTQVKCVSWFISKFERIQK